jgi:hypothetical protein
VKFHTMLGGLLVAAAYALMVPFDVDGDLWWHIRTGDHILETRGWPRTDPFSFTAAGAPWMAAEWLGDILLALSARMGGLRGLDAVAVGMTALLMLALYAFGSLRSGNSKAGFLAVALQLGFIGAFSLRPQLLGILFLVLTLIVLERFRQTQSKWIWLLPPLFLVWINTHGSWIIGLGAIGIQFVAGLAEIRIGGLSTRRWTDPERGRLLGVLLLCIVMTAVTPYGLGLALYPFTVASSLPISLTYIAEWRAMPFDSNLGKYFLATVAGFSILQVAFQYSWRIDEWLTLLFATAMSCLHVRFLLLFVPFFTPLLATALARWMSAYREDRDHPRLNGAILAVIVLVLLVSFPSDATLQAAVAKKFPVKAVDFIESHPTPGRLLNSYNFGGYLLWSKRPVFIDGRSELYEATGVLRDYAEMIGAGPNAMKLLETYGIESCLLEPHDPLAGLLALRPDWRRAYEDDVSVLYVRNAR